MPGGEREERDLDVVRHDLARERRRLRGRHAGVAHGLDGAAELLGDEPERGAGVRERPGRGEQRRHESSAIASNSGPGRSRTRTQYVRAKNVRSDPRRGSSA